MDFLGERCMEGFAEKRIKKEEGENEFREGEVTTEDGEQRQEKKAKEGDDKDR